MSETVEKPQNCAHLLLSLPFLMIPQHPYERNILSLPHTQAHLKAIEEQLSPSKEDEYMSEIVDVPYEVEEEQVVEKEEMREEIVEKKYPQVKAVYAYSGHGMKVAKGEVCGFLCYNQVVSLAN